jgi:hypothetical protein
VTGKGTMGGLDASGAARAGLDNAGVPAKPAWAGYWTWVAAVIIIMFVLYLAQKGRLGVWLAFFSWTSPAQIATTGATSTSSSTTANSTAGSTGSNWLTQFLTSNDPIADPVSKAISGSGSASLPGSAVGLGN